MELDKAFNELKVKVKDVPILALPIPSQSYVLETRAGDYALEVALFQDRKTCVLQEHKDEDTQVKWPTFMRELNACTQGMETLLLWS